MGDTPETDGPLTIEELAALRQATHEALDGGVDGKQRGAMLRAVSKLADSHGVDTRDLDGVCPECGAHTESITDMFRGLETAVDNFDEARGRLVTEERECVLHEEFAGGAIEVESAKHFDWWEDKKDELERETLEYVLADEHDPDSDVGVPATERWCTECDWSERVL